jgi:hypothetical protein
VSRLDINLMKRAELTLIYLNLSLVWLWTTWRPEASATEKPKCHYVFIFEKVNI